MRILLILLVLFFVSCKDIPQAVDIPVEKAKLSHKITTTSLVVLGNVQDAGSPHIACTKVCCRALFNNPDVNRKVICLGLVDIPNKKTYVFDATPDMSDQFKILKSKASFKANEIPNGIFLTHFHIGHYTGLMYLGKEAINAHNAIVYAMPRMRGFLESNGPWDQLVTNENIVVEEIQDKREIALSPELKVIPNQVPHRDEYSETMGFMIIGPKKSALYIPDIDKWSKWKTNIVTAVAKVDIAFLDATFYDAKEVNHRDIAEIPHPFVFETKGLFKNAPDSTKNKIHFIHMNHTNPLLNPESEESKSVLAKGFNIARINAVFEF
jgi:pyrroloquinoline quinone biosynthesis protein B